MHNKRKRRTHNKGGGCGTPPSNTLSDTNISHCSTSAHSDKNELKKDTRSIPSSLWEIPNFCVGVRDLQHFRCGFKAHGNYQGSQCTVKRGGADTRNMRQQCFKSNNLYKTKGVLCTHLTKEFQDLRSSNHIGPGRERRLFLSWTILTITLIQQARWESPAQLSEHRAFPGHWRRAWKFQDWKGKSLSTCHDWTILRANTPYDWNWKISRSMKRILEI